MKVKKKVPELRFPGFSGEWEEKRLGDLGEFGKSYSYSRKKEGKGECVHIHYGDIHSKYNGYVTVETDIPSIEINKEHELLKNGDIVIADASEDYKDLGKTLVIKDINNKKIIAGLHTFKFTPNKNLNSMFYLYFTQTNLYRKFVRITGTGISVYGLSKRNMGKMNFNLPSLPEPQKIGNYFFTLDKRIELQQQKVESLEEEKKWIMQKIFSQEIRFKDENGNDYPEWEEKKLEEMVDSGDVELGRGKVISKRHIEENPGNNPVYSSSIINDGIMGYTNDYMFNEELITWSIDGGGNFFYRNKHRFSVTNVSGIMKVNTRKYNYKFIHSQLEILHSQLKFDYIAKAHPSVIVGIYTLMLPSLPEQQKIANFLSTFDNKIEKEREKLEQLRELKRGLLQKMFV